MNTTDERNTQSTSESTDAFQKNDLIIAVQADLDGNHTVLLLCVEVAMVLLNDTIYVLQSVTVILSDADAANGIAVWILKPVKETAILLAQLQMNDSLFRWQVATGFDGIVKCVSDNDAQRQR